MQLSFRHKSIALIIALLIHASLIVSFKTQQQGTTVSGLEGIQLTFSPPPSYSAISVEEVTLEEAEIIEVEQEITPIEIVEVEPVKVPKKIPTYHASVKPIPKKKTTQPKKAQVQAKLSENKSDTDHLSQQTPSTSRGVISDSGNTQKAQASYQSLVAAILQKHKKYPSRAVSRRQEGTVTVKFIVKKTGDISSYELTSSSGYKLLDRAVEKMLKKATPLPPFPDNLTSDTITLILPVEFYLKS